MASWLMASQTVNNALLTFFQLQQVVRTMKTIAQGVAAGVCDVDVDVDRRRGQ
jgi:hypothetical protein